MEEIAAHIYKQLKMMQRRPAELAWIFVYPLTGLLTLGIFIYFIVLSGGPASSMMFVFVGIVVWNFYELTQRALTYSITFDIWNSSLKHSFSAKSTIRHFILGNSIFGLITSIITFFIVGAVGVLAFDFNIFAGGIFLLNLAPVFIFAIAMGLIIDALMVSKGQKYMDFIWTLPGIIMIFSGIYYPVSVLPSPIAEITLLIPPTHSINSMRAGFGYSPEAGFSEFWIGLISSVVCLLAAYWIFDRGLKKGYENGTITHY